MRYSVDLHIPGEIKIDAGSPEEARQKVEAMDASELAPFLGWTVVDTVVELPPGEE